MDIIIKPSKLKGTITAIPSKSQAHRVLICSAFSDRPTKIICPSTSLDIEATVGCLTQLGANIQRTEDGYLVIPIAEIPSSVQLDCQESGSTFRFLLPVVAAKGITTVFHLSGRLAERPILPLWELLEANGCRLSRPSSDSIRCEGKLRPSDYTLTGDISSQFVSGLLFACALMEGTSRIHLTGSVQSKPYIRMTQSVLERYGVNCTEMIITGRNQLTSPGHWVIEGDWSNAAFFLAANALGSAINIENLPYQSCQGDQKIIDLLHALENQCSISAADIPDLIPILSLVASYHNGTTFVNTARLRFKESDRVDAIVSMLNSLGCRAEGKDNQIIVYPAIINGGTVNTFNDHRIAMTAAIAATVAKNPVTILNAQCVEKSYPGFWDDYRTLGGNYEQYIR